MKRKKDETSKWMNAAETARYLGLHLSTIWRLIRSEEIPASRVGKLWRFHKDELDTWIRRGRNAAAKEIEIDSKVEEGSEEIKHEAEQQEARQGLEVQ